MWFSTNPRSSFTENRFFFPHPPASRPRTIPLANGGQARALFATGWAGFAASVREIEQSEAVGKIKESTVSIIDRSMDGLSKVRDPLA